MIIYIFFEAIVAVIAGILIAACSRKAEGVVYGKLDKAGRITNIVLTLFYLPLAAFCMIFSIFAYPAYDGFLGILGWIVTVIIASAPLYCGLSLGFSVALRKKGKSKQSFAMQFGGLVGCILSFGLFVACYDNLLSSLN